MKKIFFLMSIVILIMLCTTKMDAHEIGIKDTRIWISGSANLVWDDTHCNSGWLTCPDFGICAVISESNIHIFGFGDFQLGMVLNPTPVGNTQNGELIITMDGAQVKRQ